MKYFYLIAALLIIFCAPASAQWVKINAPELYIDFFYTWQDYLYAGTEGHGVYVSEDGGDTWTQLVNGISAGSVNDMLAINQNSTMLLFAALSDSGVYISADSGKTWRTSNAGLIDLNARALTCKNDTIFVGTYKGAHRSVDFGQSWSPCTTGMDDRSVNGFSIHQQNLFASSTATSKGGVFRSSDGGNSWQEKNNCTDGNVYMTSIGATDLEVLDSRIYANCGTILLTSDDNGDSWQNSGGGLIPGMYITDLAGYEGYMFLSQFPSIFMRNTDSTKWQNISDNLGGLGSTMMNAITIHNEYMYLAGNFYNLSKKEVYRRPLSELITSLPDPLVTTPRQFLLEQNYPNPFNPTTLISYIVESQNIAHIQLSIYNTIGQKVATLVNERQPAGKYSVQWNASGFTSGVYLCILSTTEGLIQIKKLVLLK